MVVGIRSRDVGKVHGRDCSGGTENGEAEKREGGGNRTRYTAPVADHLRCREERHAGRIPVRVRDVRPRAYTPTSTQTLTRQATIEITTHIKAITFDFWNTLYAEPRDGSAESSRAERMTVIRDALAAFGLAPTDEELHAAWRSGFTAYLEAWQEGRHFGAFEQVLHMMQRFDASPVDGVVARIARRIEKSGAHANLQLQAGAAEVIPALASAGIKLGLISDTGLTPGRILVGFLERDGLLPHFTKLTFSDETGFPKPDPRMFHRTLAPLGVMPEEAAHVGDTPRTDIAGAQAVGMRAIRFAAAHDTAEPPPADYVIYDHRDLLPLAGLPRQQAAEE